MVRNDFLFFFSMQILLRLLQQGCIHNLRGFWKSRSCIRSRLSRRSEISGLIGAEIPLLLQRRNCNNFLEPGFVLLYDCMTAHCTTIWVSHVEVLRSHLQLSAYISLLAVKVRMFRQDPDHIHRWRLEIPENIIKRIGNGRLTVLGRHRDSQASSKEPYQGRRIMSEGDAICLDPIKRALHGA